jgi:hypothetical protein
MGARDGKEIIATPTWVLVVRVFQLIFSIIVIGASGWLLHGYYFPTLGFAVLCVRNPSPSSPFAS